MTGASARAFHDATKHTVERVKGSGHSLDWANKPHPFKECEGLERVALPEPDRLDVPALEALGEEAPERRVDAAALARILVHGAGVLRRVERGGEVFFFRTYASAGALYPVEVYVVCGELEGLEAGVYHFDPLARELARLRSGDHRGQLVRAGVEEPGDAALVLGGIPWRTCWKYAERGYRHLFWDAGTILANVLALAASAGCASRVECGFADGEVECLLGLDGEREFPLCLVPLGAGEDVPAAHASPEPVSFDVRPLSRERVEYPEVAEVHLAGRLEGADGVREWRGAEDAMPPPPDGDRVEPPRVQPPPDELEAVIRRRGSARRFGPGAMALGVLGSILDTVTDRRVRPFLIAHAVEGLEAGAYAWDEGELVLLRTGDLRREAAYLCLGQRLGGSGAVTVFLMADLRGVLASRGDRGYRVAQLAGGIAAGRLYLAAHAHGFGATGLTFFDDDVTAFFSPAASGLEPMLVVAMGERVGGLLPLA